MKICSVCSAPFTLSTWQCPLCGHTPPTRNGYIALAPAPDPGDVRYMARAFEKLAKLEPNHFWFRARNRLIVWALARYFPHARSLLEIGCGTGYVLDGIRQAFPQLSLGGSEIFSEGLDCAAQRLPGVPLFLMDARRIMFEDEFDVLGAFDVLEHIDADEQVLAQMYRAVRPGGGILITVPQHPFLWSYADEVARHVRRYRAGDLRAKLERAGFRMVRSTSFVSLLLPLMMLARRAKQRTDGEQDLLAELRLPAWKNRLLEWALNLECVLIRWHVPLPAGGSLLMIARKGKQA